MATEGKNEGKNSAGDLLKQARLRQRLSIAECAKRTHIATRYLEALEEEKWSSLPSESHRLGFLSLYSKFLGVSSDEVVTLYKKGIAPAALPTTQAASTEAKRAARSKEPSGKSSWNPTTVPQMLGLGILLFVLAWLIYHAVSPHWSEQNSMPLARRQTSTQSRLVVPKPSVTAHKVRIQAVSDSWMRVTSKNELLYEGILPAGVQKEWAGAGPFQIKIGNIRALTLFWNDQPVDITIGSRGPVNDIRIPPQ